MKTWLINYAHNTCYHSQRFNAETGKETGEFDVVISYGHDMIDEEFKNKNEHILSQPRGSGYWLWKPYIIWKTMEEMSTGDCLMYADSDTWFIHSVKPLIEPCNSMNGVLACYNYPPYINAHWTKRDCFVEMDVDREEVAAARQLESGCVFFQKNELSVQFVEEWLRWCQVKEILTDVPNICGKENYPGFIEHRHDQSIFTFVAYRLGVSPVESFYRDWVHHHPLGIPRILYVSGVHY